MEILKCDKAVIDKFDDSVVMIEFEESESIHVDDLHNIERSVANLLGNQPYYAINVLPQCFKNFTFDAKNFVTDENQELDNRLIDCYVAGSLAKRLELEVFFQFHKPTRKTKIFNSLKKALTYIEGKKKLEVNKRGVLV
ncbi:MAG: hypothetical protein R3279_10160 [Putridiphycobacter sp.]|nr:hypothetical protein [Putridiphycobacter sp.]